MDDGAVTIDKYSTDFTASFIRTSVAAHTLRRSVYMDGSKLLYDFHTTRFGLIRNNLT